jgi:hypothetical protein
MRRPAHYQRLKGGPRLSDDLPYDPRFDEHVKAIGRVAVIWAQFEFFVNETIWELADLERKIGACITAQMIGPAPRFKAMAALMHQRAVGKDLIDEMNVLSGRAQQQSDKRNRIVHDPWSISGEGVVQRLLVKADRKLEFEFITDTPDELNKTYVEIIRLIQDFEGFRARMLAALPAFSRKRYEQSPGIRTLPRSKGTVSEALKPPLESSQE